ncbi:hypothetical protein CPC08DRAFT_770487, partial [Agrocybe pediades]
MPASSDQCAVDANGQLRDAKDIDWFHDVDDTSPIQAVNTLNSEQGRGKRVKNTSKLEASLAAEKLDDNGQPIAPKPQRRSAGNPKPVRQQDTDIDMDDDGAYVISSGSEDEDDGSSSEFSDNEIVVTNDELASVLPSKTIPLTAAGNTASRKKRKAKRAAGPATSSKKHNTAPSPEIGQDGGHANPSNVPSVSAPPT